MKNRIYRRWVSIWQRFPQRAKNFTDVGRRFEFDKENKVHESGKWFWIGDKKLSIKTDYETVWKIFQASRRKSESPKADCFTRVPCAQSRLPHSSAQSRLPHSSAERRARSAGRRAPSAHFFRASSFWGVSLQLGKSMFYMSIYEKKRLSQIFFSKQILKILKNSYFFSCKSFGKKWKKKQIFQVWNLVIFFQKIKLWEVLYLILRSHEKILSR